MIRTLTLILAALLLTTSVFAQFGKNRVQYKSHEWFYIQTQHFDIYFTGEGTSAAEFTATAAEEALEQIHDDLDYKINNRIALIVYDSHNDFQETNTTDSYLSQGVGGFTEPFKNRVVFPFEGSYRKFRHVIHHELVHAVIRDMLYGGTIQNIIAKGLTINLPHWYHEGMAEYLSTGWETNSDMFLRNAILNELTPDINQLGGYWGYRGGQSVFYYISRKYGREKLGELLNKTQGLGNLNAGMKATIGLTIEELSERWKKDLKKRYWPEIAERKDPDDFAKRLTENEETGGFYYTSPAISPQGDKVAFISDKNIFMNVYIMDIFTGKIIKTVVESGQTNNFEELNVLFPSLSWAPDNKRIALTGKFEGYDVINIVNTETEETERLPFQMDGIESVAWSPDGSMIAFNGATPKESDIYVYDFDTKELINITSDVFSDFDPSWSPDSKRIFFSSDRKDKINDTDQYDSFYMLEHDYKKLDLYYVNVETKRVTRITDWELSDERFAVVSPDGKNILFSSDYNGITNIYKKNISLDENPDAEDISGIKAYPITNSLNGLDQLSLSRDGKKLLFTSLFKGGYNIFLINNPFDVELEVDEIEPTDFMAKLREEDKAEETLASGNVDDIETDSFTLEPEVEDEKIAGEKKQTAAKKHVESDSLVVAEVNKSAPDSVETKAKEEKDKSRRIFTGQYVADEDTTGSEPKNEDYSNYIFGGEEIVEVDSNKIKADRAEVFAEKLDDEGNYLVNEYRVNFSPDLIYANAQWSTLYGVLGTTVLSFSDVLGNHRLIGLTGLQIDLKNSDYGLAYYYLPERIDYGIEAFHTARFVYLNRGPEGLQTSDLFRFRNFGAVLSASLPFSRFERLDASLSVISVSGENLDNLQEPTDEATYILPSLSISHDNVLWGYTAPIQGLGYRVTLFGDPGITEHTRAFYSITFDYRNYFRFWYDNSFVFRLSGGFSGGANPQRFYLGGTENWINREFHRGDVPIDNASDFAFLTPALPMRGYDYGEKIGTKYSLMNLELRMPLIRYLLTGPLPLLFRNILGVAFVDMGAAWTDDKALKLLKQNEQGITVADDLLLGTGVGARMYLLFFLLRVDVAWKYNLDTWEPPRYYFSIGADF